MAEAGGHQLRHGAHLVAGLVALFACCVIAAFGYRLNQAALLLKQPLYLNGTASVWDGDSLTVQKKKVRLFAVDAPELQQTCLNAHGRSYECGEAAAAALRALVGRTPLSCEVVRTDRYQRIVARCTRAATLFQRSVDLSMWLLDNGHALVYRQYAGRYLGRYEQLEAAARKSKRGIWAGEFTLPWVWRKDKDWA